MKKYLDILVILGLLGSVGLNFFLLYNDKKLTEYNRVNKIIDGDTFVLNTGQRVRLLGINAPEVGLCGSQEATTELSKLTLNKNVVLVDTFTDTYSRMISLVYVNNVLVNEKLLEQGFGRADGASNSQSQSLRKASQYAQENKLGLYSSLCRKENPEQSSCLIKGNIDKITKEKRYHFPGCREYNNTIVEKDLGENWFCTDAEAVKAGYTKAQNCFGKIYK